VARAGEFDLIARYFAPLAAGAPGAFGLRDDAAAIEVAPGRRLVATADALVAGVHFMVGDAPGDIAAKMLRVNLSDLAAMGAEPRAYLMTLALPESVDDDWLAAFASELSAEQNRFGITLIGGDTVATSGPLTLSVTALGEAETVLRRDGARAGDTVFASGTIGDAALGLALLNDPSAAWTRALAAGDADHLIARYRRPEPRLRLGQRLIGLAGAAIDVSDGLVADLGHICEVSRLGARLRAADAPLSPAARRALQADPSLRNTVLAGGDDYELLFTAPPDKTEAVATLAADIALALTPIGDIVAGEGVTVLDETGAPIHLNQTGYRHF